VSSWTVCLGYFPRLFASAHGLFASAHGLFAWTVCLGSLPRLMDSLPRLMLQFSFTYQSVYPSARHTRLINRRTLGGRAASPLWIRRDMLGPGCTENPHGFVGLGRQ
jgi:hypothetical protein